MSAMTPEDLAELRKRSEEWAGISTSASESADRREADEATLIKSLLPHSPGALEWFLALLDETDAQAARIAELEARTCAVCDDTGRLDDAVAWDCGQENSPCPYCPAAVDKTLARIAELEAKVAAQDKTLRSWAGPVAGYAEDPARQLKWAQERIAELERERGALRSDFERYAKHAKRCPGEEGIEGCQCGLWLARRRWAGEKK